MTPTPAPSAPTPRRRRPTGGRPRASSPPAPPERRPFRPRAFTLAELLVTLAVVAALAALTLPLARFAVNRSRAASCLANLRTIATAIEGWLADHSDHLPDLAAGRHTKDEQLPTLDNTLASYLDSPDAFHCPADPVVFARSGCSYLWNSTQSGRHKLQLSFFGLEGQPQCVPLVTDKEAWHPGGDGVNILYADYRVSHRLEFRAAP